MGASDMTGGRVVVLGRTGRNFAAGMSGGLAYVLDADGSFVLNCNLGMVELGRLEDEAEVDRVRELITRHLLSTGSAVAERVLRAWPMTQRQFVAVIPRDVKRVREADARAHAESAEAALSHRVA